MNNRRRITIVIGLIVAGATLAYALAFVDHNAYRAYNSSNTLMFSWETQPDTQFDKEKEYVTDPKLLKQLGVPDGHGGFQPYIPPRTYLYIAHGISGVLLGLVVPLVCWTLAAFVALGMKEAAR